MNRELYHKITGSTEEFDMASEMRQHLKKKEMKRKGFNTCIEWIMEAANETNPKN